MSVHDQIIAGLAARGLQACFASLSHIGRVKERIYDLQKRGLLSDFFMQRYLSWAEYNIDLFPEARSILTIARPEPVVGLCFHCHDREIYTILPPAYIYTEVLHMMDETVEELISPHRCASTKLPVKTLAVSAGLAQYGRNNICYVEGMGSFVRLFAYYTDIPFDRDKINEQPVMYLPSLPQCMPHWQHSGGAFSH